MKRFEQTAAVTRQEIDVLKSENEQAIRLINATG